VIDTTPIRRAVTDASDTELDSLASEIREALEGPSNDAEHDALAAVADFLGIDYDPDAAYDDPDAA
jgi:hypothetical protein